MRQTALHVTLAPKFALFPLAYKGKTKKFSGLCPEPHKPLKRLDPNFN
jgi:hypothetical protein